MLDNLGLGRQGEKSAAEFLRKNGYRILAVNYRCRLGEVDIIARDKECVCFVEVKSRLSDKSLPLQAIDKRKQRQIAKAAISFLKEKNLLRQKARFDVVSLRYHGRKEEFFLLKDAFELPAEF